MINPDIFGLEENNNMFEKVPLLTYLYTYTYKLF